MENKNQNESRELSAQELANVSGGVAKYEPTGEYPTDELYKDVSEAVTKQLADKKLPSWNDKEPYKYSHVEAYNTDSPS